MYELFLKSHLVFALALGITLWFHIRPGRTRSTIFLGIAALTWLGQHAMWAVLLVRRNWGSRFPDSPVFNCFPSQSATQAVQVKILPKRPWKATPGQYVYLTLPKIAPHRLGFVQSHPYMIAWADERSIVLLIERAGGLSDTIFTSPHLRSSVIIDGPYGHEVPLNGFDKVLFMASGIGIAAHLLPIKRLLEAHEDQSARVRRLTLVWFLESHGISSTNVFGLSNMV